MRVDRTRLRLLAGGIAGWTALTWGGRIGLLTGDEASDPATWARVGGSLALGAVGAVAAWRAADRPSPWTSTGLAAFAVWNVMIWGSSLVTTWQGDYTPAFKGVHTGLAAGSLALAGAAAGVAVGSARRSPSVD
jgi:hypothetical protein